MEPSDVTGSCLCGAVQFEIGLPTLACGHCHCSMCRRAHGAGYVTWVVVHQDRFRVTAGKDDVVAYRSSDRLTRSFCGRCGASMFCDDHRSDERHVTLANLLGPIDRAPQAHVFFDCGAPWVKLGDELPRLGGDGGMQPL